MGQSCDIIPVYFRKQDKTLGRIDVNDCILHEEAIELVKESLTQSGEGWNLPVLAFIKGEKNNGNTGNLEKIRA
jgi:hypothetical protein